MRRLSCPIAQAAAKTKDVSYAISWEEALRAERDTPADLMLAMETAQQQNRLKDKRRAGIMARPAKVTATTG